MLCGVPKCKQAVVCILEKMRVFDKLHSSMSSAVGHEFNVIESMNIDKYLHPCNSHPNKNIACLHHDIKVLPTISQPTPPPPNTPVLMAFSID